MGCEPPQLVAILQTSRQKVVFEPLVPSYQQVWNSLVDIIRLATRLLREITIYNIAFVNSERLLAERLVDITVCQHGKFPSLFC